MSLGFCLHGEGRWRTVSAFVDLLQDVPTLSLQPSNFPVKHQRTLFSNDKHVASTNSPLANFGEQQLCSARLGLHEDWRKRAKLTLSILEYPCISLNSD